MLVTASGPETRGHIFMSGETIITLCGNLTSKPELRYTQDGVAVCNSTVASTPRRFDRLANEWIDLPTMYVRLTAWRELGENMAASFEMGARVIATGSLSVDHYETRPTDGTPPQPRQAQLLTVDEIGASVRFAHVEVRKLTRQVRPGSAADTFAPAPSSTDALASV